MSKEIDAWLEENGKMPLVQIVMHPAVVRLVEQAGFELQPVDMGPGELPTLVALPGEVLLQRLLTLVFPPEAASPEAEVLSVEGPSVADLEKITGFRRRPVSDENPS